MIFELHPLSAKQELQLLSRKITFFTQERTMLQKGDKKSFYDKKLSIDLGAGEIRTNRFLSCNLLIGKLSFAFFTQERKKRE